MDKQNSPYKAIKTSKGVEILVPANTPDYLVRLIQDVLEDCTRIPVRPHICGVPVKFRNPEQTQLFFQSYQSEAPPQIILDDLPERIDPDKVLEWYRELERRYETTATWKYTHTIIEEES